jgi:fatty acid desaturase
MKLGLTFQQKLFLTFIGFALAIVGFMVKLPPVFRHSDKQLHAMFYFLAAALLNILFAGTKLVWHVVIFVALYLFGIAIEYAQAFSNRFYRTPIHGRFDPEDVTWNLKGLIAFSMLWLLITVVLLAFKRTSVKGGSYGSEPL